jgi:hypothetical protein
MTGQSSAEARGVPFWGRAFELLLSGMLLLSAVMAIEKTSRWGRVMVPVVGVSLLMWGSLTLLSSGTAPVILTGSQCSTR